MGQQQVLLIVLAVIVIGISVVVGINLYQATHETQEDYSDNGNGIMIIEITDVKSIDACIEK